MPIVNGAYVAPTWNNDAPPAINAAELQDICDTIETYNTSKADVSYVNTFVRPNLLDNWYFVGGGSQQGGGQFPINQRGKTTETSDFAFFIDRWAARTSNSISLASDGLVITTNNSSTDGVIQSIEAGTSKLAGKTVTLSVFVSQKSIPGNGYLWISNASAGNAYGTKIMEAAISGPGLFSVTGTLPASFSNSYLNVSVSWFSGGGSGTAKIQAVKLELGDTQTLAHQENGVWVLNEVPNYREELARCQRYCFVCKAFQAYSTFGTGVLRDATSAFIFVPIPSAMRTAPSLTYSGSFQLFAESGSAIAVTSISMDQASNAYARIIVGVSETTQTAGKFTTLRSSNNNSSAIVFSADL